jgi:hypothetical protein
MCHIQHILKIFFPCFLRKIENGNETSITSPEKIKPSITKYNIADDYELLTEYEYYKNSKFQYYLKKYKNESRYNKEKEGHEIQYIQFIDKFYTCNIIYRKISFNKPDIKILALDYKTVQFSN